MPENRKWLFSAFPPYKKIVTGREEEIDHLQDGWRESPFSEEEIKEAAVKVKVVSEPAPEPEVAHSEPAPAPEPTPVPEAQPVVPTPEQQAPKKTDWNKKLSKSEEKSLKKASEALT